MSLAGITYIMAFVVLRSRFRVEADREVKQLEAWNRMTFRRSHRHGENSRREQRHERIIARMESGATDLLLRYQGTDQIHSLSALEARLQSESLLARNTVPLLARTGTAYLLLLNYIYVLSHALLDVCLPEELLVLSKHALILLFIAYASCLSYVPTNGLTSGNQFFRVRNMLSCFGLFFVGGPKPQVKIFRDIFSDYRQYAVLYMVKIFNEAMSDWILDIDMVNYAMFLDYVYFGKKILFVKQMRSIRRDATRKTGKMLNKVVFRQCLHCFSKNEVLRWALASQYQLCFYPFLLPREVAKKWPTACMYKDFMRVYDRSEMLHRLTGLTPSEDDVGNVDSFFYFAVPARNRVALPSFTRLEYEMYKTLDTKWVGDATNCWFDLGARCCVGAERRIFVRKKLRGVRRRVLP